jgi:hypothetical protein
MLLHHIQAHERRPRSAFLKFLKQLNDDAWSQVLLPQLKSRGCVAAVALTCSQLRDLCYSTVANVDLRALHSIRDPLVLGRYTQNLGAHFPTCNSIKLRVQEAENYHCMPYVLPSLRRYVVKGGMWISPRGHLIQAIKGAQTCWQIIYIVVANVLTCNKHSQYIASVGLPCLDRTDSASSVQLKALPRNAS